MNLPNDLGKLVKSGANDIDSAVSKVSQMVKGHPTGQPGNAPQGPNIMQQLAQHYNDYLQANSTGGSGSLPIVKDVMHSVALSKDPVNVDPGMTVQSPQQNVNPGNYVNDPQLNPQNIHVPVDSPLPTQNQIKFGHPASLPNAKPQTPAINLAREAIRADNGNNQTAQSI